MAEATQSIDVKSFGSGKKKGKIARKRQRTTKKMRKTFQKRARDYNSDEEDEDEDKPLDQDEVKSRDKFEIGSSENEELEGEGEEVSEDENGGIQRFSEGIEAFKLAFKKIVKKSGGDDVSGPILSAQNAQKGLIPSRTKDVKVIKQRRKEAGKVTTAVYVRSLCLSDNTQRCYSKISASPDETWSIDGVYEPPFPERKHKIVGYCKGLYCLEYENGTTLLWNPSKNEYKFLPLSELKIPCCPSPNCPIIDCSVLTTSGVRGLGFDPKSGDYKVVRHASNFYKHSKDCFCTKQVEVYSLIDNCWKEIDAEGEQYNIIDECATYVDGFCYWIGQSSCLDVIISLDLSRDEFSTVDLPHGRGFSFYSFGLILTEFRTSLSFILYRRRAITENSSKTILCWVRGVDDEWVEEMDFEFCGAERPLGFCGDFLLFEGLDCGLLIYDSQQKLFRKIVGIHDYSHCMRLSSFVKSYVFLTTTREGKSNWPLIPHKREKQERDDGD